MKKNPIPKSTPKNTDVEQAVGGQPENDADARAAGLHSATFASADEKTKHADARPRPKKANKP